MIPTLSEIIYVGTVPKFSLENDKIYNSLGYCFYCVNDLDEGLYIVLPGEASAGV